MIEKPLPFNIQHISRLTREEVQSAVEELKADEGELERQVEELKHVREELQRSRDRYRTLYDTTPVGYLTIDKNYTILEANATASKMLNASHVSLLMNKFTKFVAPAKESQDIFDLNIRQMSNIDSQKEFELEMQQSDGKRFYAYLQTSLVENPANPVQFRVTITDNTRRRQAEEEREALYHSIVQHLPDMAIYIFDRDLRYLLIDEHGLPFEWINKKKMEGKTIWNLDKQTRQIIEPGYRRALAGEYLQYETSRNGRIIHTDYVPILDKGGKVALGMAVVVDVTEQKKAEEALAKAKDELEEKVKERTERLQAAYDEIMQLQKALKEANERLKECELQIAQAQEEERRRIATELDDDSAQYLSIVK